MKNIIKGFSQFINERAQGDYFSSNSSWLSDKYGMHDKGYSDWIEKDSPDYYMGEPDEELEYDEFKSKYGSELFPSGSADQRFDDVMGQSNVSRGTRFKVWKDRHRHDISSVPTEKLRELHEDLVKMAQNKTGEHAEYINRAISRLEHEIKRRNG